MKPCVLRQTPGDFTSTVSSVAGRCLHVQTSAQGLGRFQVPDLSSPRTRGTGKHHPTNHWGNGRERGNLGRTRPSESSLNFREIQIHLWTVGLSGVAFALGDWIKVKPSCQWASLLSFFFFKFPISRNAGSRLLWSLEKFGLDSDSADALWLCRQSLARRSSVQVPLVCFPSSEKFLEAAQAWNSNSVLRFWISFVFA